MPGSTTRFGFPFPCVGEAVTIGALQGLASAIDATACDVNDLALLAPDRPRASVKHTNALAQTFAVGVPANVLWDLELFDSDNMVDLVTNNDQITIKTAGYYMAEFCMPIQLSPNTTITSQKLDVTVNGNVVLSRKFGTLALYGSIGGLLRNRLAINDAVRARYTWTGTGGPANISTSGDVRLGIRMVCP